MSLRTPAKTIWSATPAASIRLRSAGAAGLSGPAKMNRTLASALAQAIATSTAKPEFLWFCGWSASGEISKRPANRMTRAAAGQPNSARTLWLPPASRRKRLASMPQCSAAFGTPANAGSSKPNAVIAAREVPTMWLA